MSGLDLQAGARRNLGNIRKRRTHDRSKISVLDVFRLSFAEQDATKGNKKLDIGALTASQLSHRSNARRLGVDDDTLRAQVHSHLATLMNTVRLESAVDLDDVPLVARSVLNYGFQDMSSLSRSELTKADVAKSIEESLADHEPRLVRQSVRAKITVALGEGEGEVTQRVSVFVSADLVADPADIPVEFNAEVDLGAGKVILEKSST